MISSKSKQKFAFILGHVPALSKAEIERVLLFLGIEFEIIFSSKEVLILETKLNLNTAQLNERLGGTIKIAAVTELLAENILMDKLGKLILIRLKDLKIKHQKFQFGFSVYGKVNVKNLKNLGLEIKRKLKEQNINSRLVVSTEPTLSSVIVQKEKLINQGVDLLVIQCENKYYLGYTVSVQKFADYSQRDYGRPFRDDRSGMLPPKLAKIMLNFSQTSPKQTILDPFCGSGTIIQEALLLGYKKIWGSDISSKAISDTKNNINWLKTKSQIDILGVELIKADVRELSNQLAPDSIDCVVTEPYLGPAFFSSKTQISRTPLTTLGAGKQIQKPKSQTQNIILELADLYLQSFKEFYTILKSNGQVVIVFPVINGLRLEILDRIKALGFDREEISQEARGSLVYGRENQRVLREIFIFKKRG